MRTVAYAAAAPAHCRSRCVADRPAATRGGVTQTRTRRHRCARGRSDAPLAASPRTRFATFARDTPGADIYLFVGCCVDDTAFTPGTGRQPTWKPPTSADLTCSPAMPTVPSPADLAPHHSSATFHHRPITDQCLTCSRQWHLPSLPHPQASLTLGSTHSQIRQFVLTAVADRHVCFYWLRLARGSM